MQAGSDSPSWRIGEGSGNVFNFGIGELKFRFLLYLNQSPQFSPARLDGGTDNACQDARKIAPPRTRGRKNADHLCANPPVT